MFSQRVHSPDRHYISTTDRKLNLEQLDLKEGAIDKGIAGDKQLRGKISLTKPYSLFQTRNGETKWKEKGKVNNHMFSINRASGRLSCNVFYLVRKQRGGHGRETSGEF